jgi:hypothetical protein
MMGATTRSKTATMRIKPETLDAAAKVAALTGRTVSGLLEYALELYIRKNYPLAFDPRAGLELRLDEAPGP